MYTVFHKKTNWYLITGRIAQSTSCRY